MSATLTPSGLVFGSNTATISGCNSMTVNNSPTSPNHVATKSYVDTMKEGLDIKEAVLVATTESITLVNTQTIDGVSVEAGDRVLVKDQTNNKVNNGIYLCVDNGNWTRTDDMADDVNAAGFFVFVEQGTIGSDQGFVCSSDSGSDVVGQDNLDFIQFSGAGSIEAGPNLKKNGNQISFDPNEAFNTNKATSLAINEGDVNIASSGATTTVKSTLNVDEAVSLDSTLDVTGDTSVSTLDSSGETSLATGGGTVNLASTGLMTTVNGTLNVKEPVTLDSTLEISNENQLEGSTLFEINGTTDKNALLVTNGTSSFEDIVVINGTSDHTALHVNKGKVIISDDSHSNGHLVEIEGTPDQIALLVSQGKSNFEDKVEISSDSHSNDQLVKITGTNQSGGELLQIDGKSDQTALLVSQGTSRFEDVYIGSDLNTTGTSTASSHVSSSDRRLKKNIRVIKDCLGKVKKIRGVNFTWIKDGKKDFGVIAQEIEKVAPFAVKESEDGMKKVDYGKLAPLFIQSIKEQQQIIEDQQDEIDGLKEQFEDLKAKVAELAK